MADDSTTRATLTAASAFDGEEDAVRTGQGAQTPNAARAVTTPAGTTPAGTTPAGTTPVTTTPAEKTQSDAAARQSDTAVPDSKPATGDADNETPAVSVSKLVKHYGDMVALDYFDLEVRQGEIFGLLGPNGSGKTTAINCILALLTYDSGTIRVFGQPMTPTSYALKRRIGIVPQNVAVFNELTVTENIDYFCSLYVPKKADRAPLVEEAIEFA
ncbi:ABC transporter, partial [Bifidobacterium myosotis]